MPKLGFDDFFANGGTVGTLTSLCVPAQDALCYPTTDAEKSILPYKAVSSLELAPREFPLFTLPPTVRQFASEIAATTCVAPDFPVMSLIAAAGAVIGRTACLEIKGGWREFPIFWAALVADSGSGKTPAMNKALGPIRRLQSEAGARHKLAKGHWESTMHQRQKESAPIAPPPALEHFWSSDQTVEAVCALLPQSAGLLVLRDELTGWLSSFNAYRKGGDRQSYMSMYSCDAIKVDRKTSDSIIVETPVVSVLGGLQPVRLQDLAKFDGTEDGFMARFEFVWPFQPQRRFTEDVISSRTEADAHEIFSRLRSEQKDQVRVLRLTDEARSLFAEWFNDNEARGRATSGFTTAWAAKAPGRVARFALVLHAFAHPDFHDGDEVDATTMANAIEIVGYLWAHLQRVSAAVGRPDYKASSLSRRVLQKLQSAEDGWLDRTSLSARLGGHTDPEELTAALTELGSELRIEHQRVPTGRRPRDEYRVHLPSENTGIYEIGDEGGIGSTASISAPPANADKKVASAR